MSSIRLGRSIRAAGWLRLPARLLLGKSGATAVEFALVAAPFLALVIVLLQTAMVFLASRVLDETVSQASRYIMTGQAQTSNMSATQFTTWVCQNSYSLFSCGNFMLNVQNFTPGSSIGTATPTLTFDAQGQVTNSWTYSPGNPGDIVVVQVMYQWPIVLGPLGFNLANLPNGNRLLIATAVFKNEPYQ